MSTEEKPTTTPNEPKPELADVPDPSEAEDFIDQGDEILKRIIGGAQSVSAVV